MHKGKLSLHVSIMLIVNNWTIDMIPAVCCKGFAIGEDVSMAVGRRKLLLRLFDSLLLLFGLSLFGSIEYLQI